MPSLPMELVSRRDVRSLTNGESDVVDGDAQLLMEARLLGEEKI